MTRPAPKHLSDMIRHGGGWIKVTCRRCGRTAHFDVSEVSSWCFVRRLPADLDSLQRVWRCARERGGCDAKRVQVAWIETYVGPPEAVTSMPPPCPIGIDPRAWALADSYERKRLIRAARG